MLVGANFLRYFVLVLFFGYSFELEFQSEETIGPKPLSAAVEFGKRLKLVVENVDHSRLRWKFNGTYVSEKCEVQTSPTNSSLICFDMDWSDEGLYECQEITQSGQSVLLAVYVKVEECGKSAKQEVQSVASAIKNRERCFCSGITDNCEMADNLYRRKIVSSFRDRNIVRSNCSSDSNSLPFGYYSLPEQLKGNLLMSYGGFLDIPVTSNENNESPDIVLQGSDQTLVYHHNQELEISGELNRKRVLMTEQDWRHLNGSHVPRNTFMIVLSNVKEFYIKTSASSGLESLDVVLDSADYKDHGLGKVTTIEKCACHVGYAGLSCEECAKRFFRRHAIGFQGVCVSIKETWDKYKKSYALRQHFDSYLSRLRA